MDDTSGAIVAELIAGGTNIQHLKDNYLLQIFSSHSLTMKDLCSLAETSQRFQSITQRVVQEFSIEDRHEYAIILRAFQQKPFRIDGRYSYAFTSANHVEEIENGSDVARIIKNFGSLLSILSIRNNEPRVVESIAKYCTGGTLTRLEIRNMDVDESFAAALEPIFQQLRILRIIQAPITCPGNPFANCHLLTELEIISSTLKCKAVLENFFPNLKRFGFGIGLHRQFEGIFERKYGQEFETITDTLFQFIERHSHLKTLALNSRFVYRSGDFVHTIGNNCKTLEELKLQNFYDSKISLDYSKLQSMTKLRMLDVDIGFVNYGSLGSLLQTLKSLEIVKLSHVSINPMVYDDVLPLLSQLGKLRELHLFNCATSYHFSIPWIMLIGLRKLHLIDFCGAFSTVDIIEQLTDLQELVIDIKEFAIDQELFSEIVKMVEGRSNVLTLKCRFKLSETLSEDPCEIGNVKLINLN